MTALPLPSIDRASLYLRFFFHRRVEVRLGRARRDELQCGEEHDSQGIHDGPSKNPKQQRALKSQATHIAKLEQDRQLQTAAINTQAGRIAELERERQTLKEAVAEIAELEQQTAHLARLLDQQRSGPVTAGLGLK